MFPLTQVTYNALVESGVREINGYPFVPLDAYGMPPVGPDFINHARSLGATVEIEGKGKEARARPSKILEFLHFRALYDPTFTLPIPFGNRLVPMRLVPGHVAAAGSRPGPQPADAMVIGKHPGKDEEQYGRNFVGPTSAVFWQACHAVGIPESAAAKWYLTNLQKFNKPDPNASRLTTGWLQDSAPLLQAEFRIVQPKYILCLGADASNMVAGSGVDSMRGRVKQIRYPVVMPDGEVVFGVAQVMAIPHPAQVVHKPEIQADLEEGLALWWQLLQGHEVGGKEYDIDHRVVFDEATLAPIVDEILASTNPADFVMSVDAEWHKERPEVPGSYLRTIQFSNRPKFAVCVVLRHAGGNVAFREGEEVAFHHLRRLFTDPRMRIGGAHLRADYPWLLHKAKIDIMPNHRPPETPEETRDKGGWDLSLMENAINETGKLGLEIFRAKYTTAPPYEAYLEKWLKEYCRKNKLEPGEIEGFGDWDGPEFYAYACLNQDSLVQLGDGSWQKIGRLVRDRYAGEVVGFKDGRVQNVRVTNWHRHDVNQTAWFRVRTASTPRGRHGLLGPVLTPDHKVVTQRGKVQLQQLVLGQDRILTEERELSSLQLSIVLGSLLGDGGFQTRNDAAVGFGFSQRPATAAYADWKAASLAVLGPKLRSKDSRSGYSRYETRYGSYLRFLSEEFPVKPLDEHGHRKLRITEAVLASLGDLGLAVWYQDDGTLVRPKNSRPSAKLYCRIDAIEESLVVPWLTGRLGAGVSYNRRGGFLSLHGVAFDTLQEILSIYGHPAFAYKMVNPPADAYVVPDDSRPFYEPILELVPFDPKRVKRRGMGVRYCLTTESGNFLTQAGFVSNCYDADVPRRCFDVLQRLLDHDRFGNNSRQAFHNSHAATAVVAEMEETGILTDPARIEKLAERFVTVRNILLSDLQQKINWPDFNPRSQPQKVAFLFGDELGREQAPPGCPTIRPLPGESVQKAKARVGKAVAKGEIPMPAPGEIHWIYQRPEGAVSMNMQPIVSTGKRPKPWERVIADNELDIAKPSTAKETLGILSQSNKLIRQLRDVGFLNQALSTTLRRPDIDKTTGEYEVDENGEYVYEAGLPSYIGPDSRIHTHIRMTMETGRSSSRRPNLQAISSRREDDYRQILGFYNPKKDRIEGRYRDLPGLVDPTWQHPMRSIFCASPGHLLIEADYTGAELAAIFWMAQDPQGIEDARRNSLKEDDPNYFDIHSNSAVMAFHLTCLASKEALDAEGKSGLRTAAKNVNFGIPYQRGAEAIARQCREEGVEATIDDAKTLINYYFNRYPRVADFLEQCKAAVEAPGYIRGAFGRYRRFAWFPDTLHDAQRQACNFPIQNLVADAMWRALRKMELWREENKHRAWFKFLLQIHDAALTEVPFESVPFIWRNLFRDTMVNGVDVWPCDLLGNRLPLDQPYHLAADQKMMFRWGEEKNKDLAAAAKLLKSEDPKDDAEFVTALYDLEATHGYKASLAA